ncbi:unnamed protein product, partial [Didymodactylos carnosus]
INAAPTKEDMRVWNAVIMGPTDTCFEDGTFTLRMEFSDQYPLKPPNVRFTCKMFHPNVYADGSICLDILQRNWSPTYDVISILTSIRSLLNDPNPNSPANNEAAKLFLENKRLYETKVKKLIEEQIMNDQTLLDDEDEEKVEKKPPPPPSATEIAATAASTSSTTSEAAANAQESSPSLSSTNAQSGQNEQ